MAASFTVLFDASVLYPAPTRDLLIQCAAAGLYRGKLTAQIHQEWISSLLQHRPDLSTQQLERTCELIALAIPDVLVSGYEPLIEGWSYLILMTATCLPQRLRPMLR